MDGETLTIDDVREVLTPALLVAGMVARRTKKKVDDKIVALLTKILNSDDLMRDFLALAQKDEPDAPGNPKAVQS